LNTTPAFHRVYKMSGESDQLEARSFNLLDDLPPIQFVACEGSVNEAQSDISGLSSAPASAVFSVFPVFQPWCPSAQTQFCQYLWKI
jgi:hypothetical protein